MSSSTDRHVTAHPTIPVPRTVPDEGSAPYLRTVDQVVVDTGADLLVIATDVDAVYLDWGTPQQRAVAVAHPDALDPGLFPAGSMGPKVEAAAQFARASGRSAVIGSLDQLSSILAGIGGTRISVQAEGMETR